MDGHRMRFQDTTSSRIGQLPDDVLVLILSFLPTLAEIARTSSLSRRWRYVWRNIPCLDFDATSLLPRERLDVSRAWYAAWVTSVIRARAAVPTAVKHLRIFYYLDQTHRHHIDQWISFAVANPLERLHLEFSGYMTIVAPDRQYELLEDAWRRSPSGLSNIKCLKSLFLSCVNVSQKFIRFIISTCPLLEELNVHLPGTCKVLDISGVPLLPLRRLQIDADKGFALTKLCAPRLTSFYYKSFAFYPLHLDVPMLTDLSIGGPDMKYVAHFRSYLPQLERLELIMGEPKTFEVKQIPKLVNLKYLKVSFDSDTDPIFGRILKLINACPLLETFALEIIIGEGIPSPHSDRRRKGWRKVDKCCSFEHLKAMELYSGQGKTMDQEIVKFIINKAPRLEKLTVGLCWTTGSTDYSNVYFPDLPSVHVLETKAKKLCQGSHNEIEIKVIA